MYAAAREAVARARAGEGPTLIEAMTFRFQGHVFGDAMDYMARARSEAAMARDPVPRFRAVADRRRACHRGRAGGARSRDRARDRRGRRIRARQPAPDLAELAPTSSPRLHREHATTDSAAAEAKPHEHPDREAVNMALDDAMALDPNVILLGRGHRRRQEGRHRRRHQGPVDASTASTRVRTTPIAEQAIIGAAIGAAIVGMRPVAEIMLMNFTTVAMDMIVNHAAKLRFMSGGQTTVPITIRTMTGAGFGTGGQHCRLPRGLVRAHARASRWSRLRRRPTPMG